jgi:cell fate (sporulation/competence/biofilm development) regulator YlbF (YheA/YmcA/DUF963 family)
MKKIKEKISDFSESIKESSEFKDYQLALKEYNNNLEAQVLWRDFQEARQNYLILQEGSFPGREEGRLSFESL